MKTVLGLLLIITLCCCKKNKILIVNDYNHSIKSNFENNFLNKCDNPTIAKILSISFKLKLNSLEDFDNLYLDATGNRRLSYYQFGKNEDSYIIIGVRSTIADEELIFYDQLVTSVEIVEQNHNTYYEWNKIESFFEKKQR